MKKILLLFPLFLLAGCQAELFDEPIKTEEEDQSAEYEYFELPDSRSYRTTITVAGDLNDRVDRIYLSTNSTGKQVDLWYQVTDRQLWLIEYAGKGLFYIRSLSSSVGDRCYLSISKSGKQVDLYYLEEPFADGTPSRQTWKIYKQNYTKDGVNKEAYIIESPSKVSDRKYVSSNKKGTQVDGWHTIESERQRWFIPGF